VFNIKLDTQTSTSGEPWRHRIKWVGKNI